MKYLKYSLRFGLLSMLILAACSDGDDSGLEQEQEEVNTVAPYDTSNILAKFAGTGLSYAINGNTVTFTTADLPNHTSPYWDASNPLYEVYNGNNDNWNKNQPTVRSVTTKKPLIIKFIVLNKWNRRGHFISFNPFVILT